MYMPIDVSGRGEDVVPCPCSKPDKNPRLGPETRPITQKVCPDPPQKFGVLGYPIGFGDFFFPSIYSENKPHTLCI